MRSATASRWPCGYSRTTPACAPCATCWQSGVSIDDQVRKCRQIAVARGWEVVEVYADHALSGASVLRPSYQMPRWPVR